MRASIVILALLAAGSSLAQTAAVSGGPAPLPLAANAEAQFRSMCRKRVLAGNPQAAKWVEEACATRWKAVAASGPAADALLGVLPASAGEALTLATAKARMPGVRWSAQGAGMPANGRLGALTVAISGKRQPDEASVSWDQVGALIPYDVAGAMEARGVRLTLAACEKLGVGEGSRTYGATASGRAPFGLTVYSREAPTANANSHYSAAVSLRGQAPPKGSTACEDF